MPRDSAYHLNSLRRPSTVHVRGSDHHLESPAGLHRQTGGSSLEAQAPQIRSSRRSLSSIRNQIAWKGLREMFTRLKLLLEQSKTVETGSSSSLVLSIDHNLPRSPLTFPDKAGQCCFICFSISGRRPFAIQIPCLRPTEHRTITWQTTDKAGNILRTKYSKVDPKDKAVECDREIYQRIRETVFCLYGAWTAWLPFYGVIDVQEAEVSQVPRLCRDKH